MNTKQFNMIYALHNNNLVHISSVPSGLKCDCVCPYCKKKLIAKKGEIRGHHFAHFNSGECQYWYETSLHLAAKQMIMEHKKIMIPAVCLKFPGGFKESIRLYPAQEIKVDDVSLEEKQEGMIVPDIVLYSGQIKLYVEIYVTHAIDNKKRSKIIKEGISTIEIDLSKCERNLEKEDLEKLLFEDSEKKRWVYNRREKKWLKEFLKVSKQMPIITRGFTQYVDDCPMKKQNWRGKSFADVLKDCKGCRFCIAKGKSKIFCSGEQRIADLEDFEKSLEDRMVRYPNQANDNKHDYHDYHDYHNYLVNGICPRCGGKIRIIKTPSKDRDNFVCINYPNCKFNAAVDKKTGDIKIGGIKNSSVPFIIDE